MNMHWQKITTAFSPCAIVIMKNLDEAVESFFSMTITQTSSQFITWRVNATFDATHLFFLSLLCSRKNFLKLQVTPI